MSGGGPARLVLSNSSESSIDMIYFATEDTEITEWIENVFSAWVVCMFLTVDQRGQN